MFFLILRIVVEVLELGGAVDELGAARVEREARQDACCSKRPVRKREEGKERDDGVSDVS